jgi:hypothetical protein
MAQEPSTAARLVDRDWFSAVAPDEALKSVCEPAIAGAFVLTNEPRFGAARDAGEDATTSRTSIKTPNESSGRNLANAHATYVETLRRRESLKAGVPCTAVWLAGAVAYRCRTCQTGEQSSICVTCFRSGNLHEGHDTVVYRSETGGACDCGDVEAWSLSGCCAAHRPRPESESRPRRKAPRRQARGGDDDEDDDDDDEDDDEDDSESSESSDSDSEKSERLFKKALRDAQTATFGLVFERLLLALESVAHARGPNRPTPAGARFAEEMRIAKALISWVTREAEFGAPLRRAAARALSSDWDPPITDAADPREEDSLPEKTKKKKKETFPNTPYGTEYRYGTDSTSLFSVELDTNAIRAELRRRRLEIKRRAGNAPVFPDWPIGGAGNCGLLECLLRASCLFCLPDSLMESVTTMLLTFLFVPKFKKKFAKALVRHYDAVARFPETLPWPGVLYRRDDSDYGDVSRSDGDGRAPSRTRRLEFPEAAYVAASPTTPDRLGDGAADRFGSEGLLAGASRALTAYASRRTTVCRCLDRVTVQLFGAAPVVAVDSMRDALLFATAKTLERCVVGRHPPKTSSRFEREEALTEGTRFDFSISRNSEDDENDVLNRSSRLGETSAGPPNEHDDRTYRPAALSFHPADEAAKHRLFARPCNDLRMLLSHRNVARRWLRGGKRSPFFASAVKTLLALSGMHAFRHKKGEHVLIESRAWIEACTAETFVNTTFRAGIACVGDGLAGDKATTSQSSSETTLEDVETLADARDALLDACVDWHDRLVWAMRRSESSVDAESATARPRGPARLSGVDAHPRAPSLGGGRALRRGGERFRFLPRRPRFTDSPWVPRDTPHALSFLLH